MAATDNCTVREIARAIEAVAPLDMACDWDNVGLQVGDPEAKVSAVLLALDVTPATLAEAADIGAELVIAHHPLIFKPRRSMAETDPEARLVAGLIRQGCAVYAAHTNLDVAPEIGVNAALALRLGLSNCEPLLSLDAELMAKLVTFVPPESVEAVRVALSDAGAGVIGEYAECAFTIAGHGSFRGSERASPTVGRAGQLETVAEVRLEMIVPRRAQGRAVEALLRAHPYEEPAFDILPLLNNPRGLGLGLVGELPQAMELAAFRDSVGERLGTNAVRVVAANPRVEVRRIAVLGGSGGGEVAVAARAGADAFVTGDVKYHDALQALALGLPVIDAGHYATERPVLDTLAGYLVRETGVAVHITSTGADPLAG